MRRMIGALLVMIIGVSFAVSGCGPSKAELAAQEAARRDREAFDTAKEAYTALCEAADETIALIDDIYESWLFGIYDADECTSSTIVSTLAKEIGVSVGAMEDAVESYATSMEVDADTVKYVMINGAGSSSAWQYCLHVTQQIYKDDGTIDNINSKIQSANAALKTMTSDFDDYKHYPILKDFYSKVSSYASFAQELGVSFEQLKNTITDYENSIRTYKSDLSFVFD